MNKTFKYAVSITTLSALMTTSVFAQNFVFREPVYGVKANASYAPSSPSDPVGGGDSTSGNPIIEGYIDDTEVEIDEETHLEEDLAIGGIVVAIRYYNQEDYNTNELTELYESISSSNPDSFKNLTTYLVENDIEHKVISSGPVLVGPLGYPPGYMGGVGDSYLNEEMGYIETSWGLINYGMGITYARFHSEGDPKYYGRVTIGQVTSWDGLSGNIYDFSNGASSDREFIGGQYSTGWNGFDDTVHHFNFLTFRCRC